MSTSGWRSVVCAAASALDKSSASPSSFAVGTFARMEAMASFTRTSVRPLTITRAPSPASALAMAKPIPAVEPLTRASLFSSWRFIGLKSGVVDQTVGRAFLATRDAVQLFYTFNWPKNHAPRNAMIKLINGPSTVSQRTMFVARGRCVSMSYLIFLCCDQELCFQNFLFVHERAAQLR